MCDDVGARAEQLSTLSDRLLLRTNLFKVREWCRIFKAGMTSFHIVVLHPRCHNVAQFDETICIEQER